MQANSLKNPESEFRHYGKEIIAPRTVKNALMVFAPQVMELFKVPYFTRDLQNFFVNVFQDNLNARRYDFVRKPRDFFDLLVQLMEKGCVVDDQGNVPKFNDKTRMCSNFSIFQKGPNLYLLKQKISNFHCWKVWHKLLCFSSRVSKRPRPLQLFVYTN